MKSFVNTSNPLSILNPCINVRAKNVAINCNGFEIVNATTAIYASGKNNLTVMNCRIRNALTYGIVLYNMTQATSSNLSLVNDSLGIQLYNSSISLFSNISASREPLRPLPFRLVREQLPEPEFQLQQLWRVPAEQFAL